MQLRRRNGSVLLSVSDAGNGIPITGEGGSGLADMRERMEAVGGVLRVDSAPGRGAKVEAEVSL